MASLNKSSIEPVQVEDYFNDTILLVADYLTTDYESLVFVSLTADENIDALSSTAILIGDDLSINIYGKHKIKIFDQNIIKSISRGSSDLLETPLITNSFDTLDPIERQVYSYQIDQRTIPITFTLQYISIPPLGLSSLETVNFTQQVFNDYSSTISTFLSYI